MVDPPSRSNPSPKPGLTARAAAGASLAVYLAGAGLLFVGLEGEQVRGLMLELWTGAKHLGLPAWVSPDLFSAAANGIAFIPLTFSLAVLFRGLPWWAWGAVGFAVSVGIELTQLLVLDTRVPDAADIAANGIGGLLGARLGSRALRRSSTNEGTNA